MNPLGQMFGATPGQTPLPSSQPSQPPIASATAGTSPMSSGVQIPAYITADQVKQLLSKLPPTVQPEDALQSLVQQGHIIQGLNDQQYNLQQGQGDTAGQGTASPDSQGFLGGIGSFLGGALKSVAQPILSGLGSGIRSLQSTPQILSGDQAGAAATMAKPMFGVKTLAGMNNEEALGTAAKAASFLAPMVPGGILAEGAVGGGAFSGGEAMTQNASTNQVVGATALGAAGGAVAGKLLSKVAPLLMGSTENAGQDVALNAYKSGFKSVEDFQKGLGQEFTNGAKVITEAAPDKGIPLTVENINQLQTIASQNGVKLPTSLQTDLSELGGGKFGPVKTAPLVNINASETQDLLTALGKKRFVSGTVNTPVQDMIDTIRGQAKTTFGQEFEDLYSSYATKSDAVKSLSDVFDVSGKTAQTTTTEKLTQIKNISEYLNDKTKAPIFKDTLANFKDVSGIDLTSQTKVIAAANKIKNPLVKQAFLTTMKIAGFGAAADIAGHILH